MEALGITEIRHLIAHTNKGELSLQLRKGQSDYNFVLDAVPLTKAVNKEMMDIFYPKAIETIISKGAKK